MIKETKTDNANIKSKLTLRRYFLDKYSPKSVVDCCQGDGIIWNTLLKEYEIKYIGIDVNRKKGRLQLDSIRYLQANSVNHDVIDIDTYGSPWIHFNEIIKNNVLPVTVFLTIGKVGGLTPIDKIMSEWTGINKLSMQPPPTLLAKFSYFFHFCAINHAINSGWKIIEAIESNKSKNARYLGLRMAKSNIT